MYLRTPIFGLVTALEGLHLTGKYRNRSMQHTCSRHAVYELVGSSDFLRDKK